MTSIIVVMVLIVVGILVFALQRGMQMRALALNGVMVKASVSKKWRHRPAAKGNTGHRLSYRFKAQSGQIYSRTVTISTDENKHYQEGDMIDVVYLPQKPQVNAMASMVQLARQALEKSGS